MKMKKYWIIDGNFFDPSPILEVERFPDPDCDNHLRAFVIGPEERIDLINNRLGHFYRIWDDEVGRTKVRYETRNEAVTAYIKEASKKRISLKKKLANLEGNIRRLKETS